jgi:hypothetical protein
VTLNHSSSSSSSRRSSSSSKGCDHVSVAVKTALSAAGFVCRPGWASVSDSAALASVECCMADDAMRALLL